MISDELFRLAFEYRKTKLWEKMSEDTIFAVKLSTGELGYISIVNSDRANYGLELYIGEQGLNSLRTILEASNTWWTIEYQESLIGQNCLLCTFEGKHALTPWDYKEIIDYARSFGIRLSGKNAFPQFIKCVSGYYPWKIEDDKEKAMLCEALSAAIELSNLLKTKWPHELGLKQIDDKTQEIAVFEKIDGIYKMQFQELPEPKPKLWPTPQASNEIGIANLKKIKKTGVWECGLLRFYRPIQNEEEDIPYYPMLLLALETSSNYMLPVDLAIHYEENPEGLLNSFINALIQQGICPKQIMVRDDRTYAFVNMFCKKLKIPLSMKKKLPMLQEAEYEFYEHFYMNEKELWNITAEMDMAYQSEKNTEKKSAKVTSIHAKQEESYIISVSLYAGCYRHIKISGKATLFQLHEAIIEAFDFDDDHAHAFFMDNVCWSDKDAYFSPQISDTPLQTKKYKLNQLNLLKGDLFKYLFDFGDEWVFQCKILRIVEEQTAQPTVIKSKGDAPNQYNMDDW